MDIEIKEEKRDGRNTKDEKQEITISVSGRLVVYGDENQQNFKHELNVLLDKYAIWNE